MTRTLRYQDFQPGHALGTARFSLDSSALAAWHALFPEDDLGAAMPHGMAAMVTMRAYCEILANRPSGNIHAAQRFCVRRLPRVGEVLLTTFTCAAVRLVRDRPRVTLTSQTLSDAGPAFEGEMTVVWAC